MNVSTHSGSALNSPHIQEMPVAQPSATPFTQHYMATKHDGSSTFRSPYRRRASRPHFGWSAPPELPAETTPTVHPAPAAQRSLHQQAIEGAEWHSLLGIVSNWHCGARSSHPLVKGSVFAQGEVDAFMDRFVQGILGELQFREELTA